MKIGIDFHVVDGKFQGSRTHVLELTSALILQSPDFDFFLFLDNPEMLSDYSSAFSKPNVHKVKMAHANPLKRLYWQLPILAKRYKLDILHTQYVLPWPLKCKSVVTIHDVLFETHPQFFKPLFIFRSRILMRLAAKKANHICTVSEYSKSEISRLYKVPSEGITVIHNGADLVRFKPSNEGIDCICMRGLIPHDYILSVGRLEPRKNHLSLVEAYAKLKGKIPPLVLIGQKDFYYEGVFTAVTNFGVEHRVHIFENVGDEELPVLYRNAKLFVYPAFAEGFGMPPLEAMAAGVPVVSSNTTSIPEVVGDAGLLVNPNDVDALALAMQHILDDASESERLSKAGRLRALSFTWESSAKILRNCYLALNRN